jgi:hypothetical protein
LIASSFDLICFYFLFLVFFRFGFALANLGDINKDRYEDLAVGAPYEGKGVVYIYLGSKHGIITEPSQVLSLPIFLFILCSPFEDCREREREMGVYAAGNIYKRKWSVPSVCPQQPTLFLFFCFFFFPCPVLV